MNIRLKTNEISMMNAIPLKYLAFKYSLENTYKSNLNDQEKILLESFLLVLEIKGFYGPRKKIDGDHKKTIGIFIEQSNEIDLKNIYRGFLEPILQKVRNAYLNPLIGHYHSLFLNLDGFTRQEYFDEQLLHFFGGQKAYPGDALQPKELTLLLNSFLPKREDLNYYNPFGGLASLALTLPKNTKYYGEELDEFIWLLAKIRLLAYDCPPNFRFENVHSIENWHYTRGHLYDYISYNPPFNLNLDESFPHFLHDEEFGDHRNANSLIVSQTFKKLKEDGRMSFVMPNGFLSNSLPKDKALKKFLVDNNHVDYIISLPNKILRFTSMQVNVIVLSKNRSRNEIRFVDGSELYIQESGKTNRIDLPRLLEEINTKENTAYSKNISLDEIQNSGYNLSLNRYVFEEPSLSVKEEEKLVKLSAVISPLPKLKTDLNSAKVINIGELSDDSLKPNIDLKNLPIKDVNSSCSSIREKVLLISMLGNKIKPSLLDPKNEEILYTRGNILAFKIKDDEILPEYLVLELHKDYMQDQLRRIRGGGGIPRIKREDLLDKIEIILPSVIEQERKISQAYYEVHQKRAEEVKEFATAYNIDVADENSFLRHQIAGSMKNIRSAFKFVKNILDKEVITQLPELYEFKANEKLPSTLGDYLKIIERDLGSMTKILNKAGTEIDLTDLEIEKIDLIKFVENYKRELESRNGAHFSIEVKKDKPALLENAVKTVYINGDREKLRQMFDNIIENAVKHAFQNKIDPSNKIVFEFLYSFDRAEVQLDISNTGKPLPYDYSHEAFTRKGSSTGKNAGDGTGGWFINEVMKLHNGHFGFTDETGPEGIEGELVTTIELTFPIIIKQ